MNERIKELARKAGISILYEYDGYDGHAGVANLDDIEKFAELIVLECAEIGLDSVEDGDDLDAIMKRVHNNILNHFGVEK